MLQQSQKACAFHPIAASPCVVRRAPSLYARAPHPFLPNYATRAGPTFSSVWIMAMNVVYAIFGIIFISLSSWGIENQKKSSQLAGATPLRYTRPVG